MPGNSETKVLDAYTLFKMAEAVTRPENEDEAEDIYKCVYERMKRGHQRILFSHRVVEEYEREMNRGGPPFTMLNDFRDMIRNDNMGTQKAGGNPKNIPGLPRHHRVFVIDGIRASAKYFITKRQQWLDIGPMIEEEHGMRVVTPEQFYWEEEA